MNVSNSNQSSSLNPSSGSSVASSAGATTNSVDTEASRLATLRASLANQRAAIEAQEKELALQEQKAKEEAHQKLVANRAAAIEFLKGLYGLEGDTTLYSLIKVLTSEAGREAVAKRVAGRKTGARNGKVASKGNTNKTTSKVATKGQRRTEAYPAAVKENAIQMRKDGDTVSSISKRLGVSEPTLNNWFKKAGLANKGLGGKTHRTTRNRRPLVDVPLTPIAAATVNAGVAPVGAPLGGAPTSLEAPVATAA